MRPAPLLALPLLSVCSHAATVNVYLAGGQSNATGTWASSIESTLQALPDANQIEVVHIAHSGSPMWQWTWGGVRRDFYNADLAAVQAKISEIEANGDTAVFSGIFWFQGEGDTGSPSTIPLYESRFQDMLSFYQQDLGLSALPNFALAIIDANPDPFYDNPANLGATREAVDEMRAALANLGNLSNGGAVDTRGFTRADGWHVVPSHQLLLGQSMAHVFNANFGVPEPSALLLSLAGFSLLARRRR